MKGAQLRPWALARASRLPLLFFHCTRRMRPAKDGGNTKAFPIPQMIDRGGNIRVLPIACTHLLEKGRHIQPHQHPAASTVSHISSHPHQQPATSPASRINSQPYQQSATSSTSRIVSQPHQHLSRRAGKTACIESSLHKLRRQVLVHESAAQDTAAATHLDLRFPGIACKSTPLWPLAHPRWREGLCAGPARP